MQPFSELHEVERRYEELAYKCPRRRLLPMQTPTPR